MDGCTPESLSGILSVSLIFWFLLSLETTWSACELILSEPLLLSGLSSSAAVKSSMNRYLNFLSIFFSSLCESSFYKEASVFLLKWIHSIISMSFLTSLSALRDNLSTLERQQHFLQKGMSLVIDSFIDARKPIGICMNSFLKSLLIEMVPFDGSLDMASLLCLLVFFTFGF